MVSIYALCNVLISISEIDLKPSFLRKSNRLALLPGRLAATGSADYSIKILDVERMMSKTAIGHNQDLHPVIRTLYDHTDVSYPGGLSSDPLLSTISKPSSLKFSITHHHCVGNVIIKTIDCCINLIVPPPRSRLF